MAEFERALTQERVRAGLRLAKSVGNSWGRPRAAVVAAQVATLRAAAASRGGLSPNDLASASVPLAGHFRGVPNAPAKCAHLKCPIPRRRNRPFPPFQKHLVLELRMRSLSALRNKQSGEQFRQVSGTSLESVAVAKGGKLNAGSSSAHH